MPHTRQIWSWVVDDLVRLNGSQDDDRLYIWERRTTTTEIFNRDGAPRVGDLLIGYLANNGGQVIALGNVASIQGVSTGRLRATIRPRLHLTSMSVSTLMSRTSEPDTDSETFLGAKALHPQWLDSRLSNEILRELTERFEEVGPWLDALKAAGNRISDDNAVRLREERDAIQTGINLAGVQMEDDAFTNQVPGPFAGATELLNPSLFSDNEDDLLFADLRRFDPEGVLEENSASTSLYRSNDVELLIANVNRKPLEHELGVDLLYWDLTANSYTLLQYKRLTKAGSAGEDDDRQWRYTRRQELEDQLSKMGTLLLSEPVDAADWRIVGNPFWFKFVRTNAFQPNDRRVLKGMYVPAAYLRLGVATDAFRGPNGGFSLGFDNVRYLTREPFIELVQRHYTGSTRSSSKEIARLIQDLAPENDIVLVAKNQRARDT